MTTPQFQSLDEARLYTRGCVCPGCDKGGTLSPYQVRAEGLNQGRLFLKCRHCGHFQWASAATARDEEVERWQAGAAPCPTCGAGREAKRVRKEGPNKGRIFLVCTAPSCGHFFWGTPAATPTELPAPKPFLGEAERIAEGLLAAIRDFPHDELPRLAYADWLEENGDEARAEFIRVSVERDRHPMNHPAWQAANARHHALLVEHGPAWSAGLVGATAYSWRGGLIDEVRVAPSDFARHAAGLLERAPVAGLVVQVEDWREVKTVAQCKDLLRFRRLTLAGLRMGTTGARILAESSYIANLKELSLAGQSLGQPGTLALIGSGHLKNLEVLDLSGCNITNSAIPALASTANLPRLRRLLLADNLLTDRDLRALASSRQLTKLTELGLDGNAITSDGAEYLAASGLMTRLRWLGLRRTHVSAGGLFKLRQSPKAHPMLVVEGG
jgi:uncharacterized protein (TIGR02996 family)